MKGLQQQRDTRNTGNKVDDTRVERKEQASNVRWRWRREQNNRMRKIELEGRCKRKTKATRKQNSKRNAHGMYSNDIQRHSTLASLRHDELMKEIRAIGSLTNEIKQVMNHVCDSFVLCLQCTVSRQPLQKRNADTIVAWFKATHSARNQSSTHNSFVDVSTKWWAWNINYPSTFRHPLTHRTKTNWPHTRDLSLQVIASTVFNQWLPNGKQTTE